MKSHRLGTAALFLGLVAVVSEAAGITLMVLVYSGAFDHGTHPGQDPGPFFIVAFIEFYVFIIGVPAALLAVILGLRAAVQQRGRRRGVGAAILGALVLVAQLVAFVVTVIVPSMSAIA
jgi:hypothetical protein